MSKDTEYQPSLHKERRHVLAVMVLVLFKYNEEQVFLLKLVLNVMVQAI